MLQTFKGAEQQELTLVVGAELDSVQQFSSIPPHSAPFWTLSLMVIGNKLCTFKKNKKTIALMKMGT